jgi:hypothetical protein
LRSEASEASLQFIRSHLDQHCDTEEERNEDQYFECFHVLLREQCPKAFQSRSSDQPFTPVHAGGKFGCDEAVAGCECDVVCVDAGEVALG